MCNQRLLELRVAKGIFMNRGQGLYIMSGVNCSMIIYIKSDRACF